MLESQTLNHPAGPLVVAGQLVPIPLTVIVLALILVVISVPAMATIEAVVTLGLFGLFL